GVLVACALGLLTPPAAGAEFEDFFLNLDGLVSHWGMSETSGTTVADSIVTDAIDGNNPGSFALGGGASLGAAGPRPSDGFAGMSAGNTAIDFSGVAGQRLDMNPAGYTGTGGLTSASLATWFRLTAPSTASRHNHIGGLQ